MSLAILLGKRQTGDTLILGATDLRQEVQPRANAVNLDVVDENLFEHGSGRY